MSKPRVQATDDRRQTTGDHPTTAKTRPGLDLVPMSPLTRRLSPPGDTVRPWERAALRPPAPKSHPTVLRDITGDPKAAGMPDAAPAHAGEGLDRARQDAEQLLMQARQEAEQIRAAAAQAGFADGQAQALDQWAEERQRLRELLGSAGEAYRRFCLDQAPELAALAAEAAEKLLYEQLSLEPQRALTLVRQALDHVHAATAITIHLNPEDEEMVRSHLLAHDSPRSPTVQLAPDPTVERGGCWIKSEHGEVDATVAGRVSRLKALVGGP